MNIVLWLITALLAVAVLGSGAMKLAKSSADLAASDWNWVEDFSDNSVKGIGILEILAAVGLTLPALLGIATVLVPLAATGVVLLMAGAAITHARRGEYPHIAPGVVLGALALTIAIFRFGSQSF